MDRRKFIATGALASAGFMIVPRHVIAGSGMTPPSDRLNIAGIGAGGQGSSDIRNVSEGTNIVALCDVDDVRAAGTYKAFPKAKQYRDYRELLDKEHKNIDAVTVSTPDHMHYPIALEAIKRGKHTYVQKPLSHTVEEARNLAKATKKYKVVTQMGNQGHGSEGARLINEWIWDGAIGDVYEVHAWTNRPIWPQNIPRPTETPAVPPSLDWNLWLGIAQERPYHPAYVPFAWRGFWDYGTGALGDMGAHILDHPFWALNLEFPSDVQASSTHFNEETYPIASVITYNFPKRGKMPAVKLKWYDGGIKPDRPKDLEPGRQLGSNGVLYYGTKGTLLHSVYGENPRIIPETKMQDYKRPEKTILRSPGIHKEWTEACKGNGKALGNFDYSSKLTEMMLLGNIATKLQYKNTVLKWDGPKLRFTNMDEANQYLSVKYRPGWGV